MPTAFQFARKQCAELGFSLVGTPFGFRLSEDQPNGHTGYFMKFSEAVAFARFVRSF